jgi:hypothetical protein
MSAVKSPYRSPLQPVNGNRRFSVASSISKITGFLSSKKLRPSSDIKIPESNSIMDVYTMDQVGEYSMDMHMPKYSQSEVDAMAEENKMNMIELQHKYDTLLQEKSTVVKKESEETKCEDTKCEETKREEAFNTLNKLWAAEISKNDALEAKLDEFTLIRTQNKALNRRLQQLEEEISRREKEHISNQKIIAAEEAHRRKSLVDKYELELAEVTRNTKREVIIIHI